MGPEIIQVIQEFSTSGGVERVAFELARAFGGVGITNRVITSVVGDSDAPATKIERIASWLSRIPTRGPLRHVGRFIVVPLFTLFATWALRRHPNATVISHGDSFKGDVLVVHAVNAESLAEKRRSGHLAWLINPMHGWVSLRDRWMIGGLRYRMFVAVSARVSEELQTYYKVPVERIRVIPNGIDLERFRPDPSCRLAVRREFGIPEEARLLLFVGHEFKRKGLAYAVGALEQLDPQFWMLVVGADNFAPCRKQMKTAISRVVFAGPQREMARLYAAADAFVLPTAYETFSLACMEAMACSVPVFATRVGGIEDYLIDGVNGFAIDADAADIATKIQLAFADDDLLQRVRAGARATALNYDWSYVSSKYIELLEEIQTLKRSGESKRLVAPPAPVESGTAAV